VPSNDLPQPGPGDLDVPLQMILPATFRIGASPHLSQAGYQQVAARVAAHLHQRRREINDKKSKTGFDARSVLGQRRPTVRPRRSHELTRCLC
jgi:hypothetical protein